MYSMTYFNLSGLRALRNRNEPNSPVGGGRAPQARLALFEAVRLLIQDKPQRSKPFFPGARRGGGDPSLVFVGNHLRHSCYILHSGASVRAPSSFQIEDSLSELKIAKQ